MQQRGSEASESVAQSLECSEASLARSLGTCTTSCAEQVYATRGGRRVLVVVPRFSREMGGLAARPLLPPVFLAVLSPLALILIRPESTARRGRMHVVQQNGLMKHEGLRRG